MTRTTRILAAQSALIRAWIALDKAQRRVDKLTKGRPRMTAHKYDPRPGDTWCRECNSEPGEPPHDDVCWDCAFERGLGEDRAACANCDRVFTPCPHDLRTISGRTGTLYECRACGLVITTDPPADMAMTP
jgi:hypothetical protein